MATRVRSFVLVTLVLVLTLPLIAQSEQQQTQQQQTTTAEQEKPKVQEEMVVTARKREETVQEVPMSIAAPSEAKLHDLGAETVEDIAANVAGFTVQNLGPGQSQVAMRGVSAGQIVRDQPGVKEQVGVYLDESVISLSLFTPDIDLFDLSRVEVLRGPQGTLFGSGSLSGTLRYITNQPQLGASSSVADLQVTSIGDGGIGGSVKYAGNIPIGDAAAMRVVAYYTQYGGYIDAIRPGSLAKSEDVNDGDRIGGRVAFRFEPNDRFRITPRILYQEIEMNGWNRADAFNILANPYTTTRPAVTLGEREQAIQFEEPFTDEFLLGDVAWEYDFTGSTLTSITSYTDRDVLVIRDATALTASITGGSIGLAENIYSLDAPLFDATQAKALTQELRLSGNRPQLPWVVGLFYSTSERDYGQNLPVHGFTQLSGIPTAGTKLALTDELYKSDLHYDFDQLALFGEATMTLAERFEVTAGLRWYDFQEDRQQIFDGIFADPIDSVGSTDAQGFAPRVILSYKLSDATSLNAQISKGFRLGGINDPLNTPLCTPADLITYGGHATWEDETLWNYEVGAKSSIAGGRGSFNASAYMMDIEDLQATVTAGSCSSRIILNVPKARSTGVEAEFELAPNDNFDFAISAHFNQSELRSTFTASDGAGGQQIVAGIKEGNRLPTVPEFQMAAAATLRRPIGGNVGYATGVYQHIGDRYTQVADQAAGFGRVQIDSFGGDIGGPYTQNVFTFDPKLPAYDLVNLRFGILTGRWDTALFINNVTDERALLALDQERGTRARVGYLINQPRTIGITTRVNF
jgi:iron complex outermembrane recepter protein